jgi:hypothetical protein
VGVRPLAYWDRGLESHRGHGCLCCVVKTVVWTVSDIKDEKDLIQYKNGSKGKNPGQAKKTKSHRWHVCLSVVSVVCCQVEVSATGWSLVQRSPTDCGESTKCVIVKPRRNEEAQAHIGLSSHI